MARPKQCQCGSGDSPEPLYDGYGIFICYACPKCKDDALAGFRPDIFERYDTDEQIEDDY